MNSGRRVRADGLVVVLVKKITPFIFARRRLQGDMADFPEQRHAQFTGNSVPVATPAKEPPLAYFAPDSDRDQRAEELVKSGSVTSVEFSAGTLTAKVVSQDLHRMRAAPYVCRLWPWVDILCTCVDFLRCGGFCKHLRGALIEVCAVTILLVCWVCCDVQCAAPFVFMSPLYVLINPVPTTFVHTVFTITLQAQNRAGNGELNLPTEVQLRGPTEAEARIARLSRRAVLSLPAPPTEEEEDEERVRREVEEMMREKSMNIPGLL